jgi:hypothetical protein
MTELTHRLLTSLAADIADAERDSDVRDPEDREKLRRLYEERESLEPFQRALVSREIIRNRDMENGREGSDLNGGADRGAELRRRVPDETYRGIARITPKTRNVLRPWAATAVRLLCIAFAIAAAYLWLRMGGD